MLENLIFLNPILWIISFLIWMIFFYLYFKTKDNVKKFKFISDIESIFWSSKKYFVINLISIFLIIAFISLLIANPNLKETKTKQTKNGIDIAIVLDLSYSMVAEDIQPNRLEVAKEVISNFTSKLTTDRVWLILFSGKPFTSVPLTFDYDFITKYIKNITIKNINQDYEHLQWTAIWDALLYWANLFEASSQWVENNSDRQKVIVLFTDGEANRWIDPLQAIKYVWEKNIIVHTVWIWWNEDTYVNFQNIYWTQKIAIWWIDEENLKAIANLTGWEYYKADNKESFEKIFEKLNLLQKKEIEVESYQIFQPFYKEFIYIIFLLFLFFVVFNSYYYLRK